MSEATYGRVEDGEPSVSVAAYPMASCALGLGPALGDLADPRGDDAGLVMGEARLPKRVRDDGGPGMNRTIDVYLHDEVACSPVQLRCRAEATRLKLPSRRRPNRTKPRHRVRADREPRVFSRVVDAADRIDMIVADRPSVFTSKEVRRSDEVCGSKRSDALRSPTNIVTISRPLYPSLEGR